MVENLKALEVSDINQEYLGDLIGIAEIATVFIGFAVLISVLSTKSSSRFHVMGIVIGASMVLVACLLPILLRTTDMSTYNVLRLSSAIFAGINLVSTIAMFRWIPGFSESQKKNPSFGIWGIEASIYLLLFLCASGVWGGYAITLYFGAVLALLFQIIVMFVALSIRLSQQLPEQDSG
jgi:hypothetical protein